MTYKGQIKYISMAKEFAIVQQLWRKEEEIKIEEEITKFLRADFSLFKEGDTIYYSYTKDISFIEYEV